MQALLRTAQGAVRGQEMGLSLSRMSPGFNLMFHFWHPDVQVAPSRPGRCSHSATPSLLLLGSFPPRRASRKAGRRGRREPAWLSFSWSLEVAMHGNKFNTAICICSRLTCSCELCLVTCVESLNLRLPRQVTGKDREVRINIQYSDRDREVSGS